MLDTTKAILVVAMAGGLIELAKVFLGSWARDGRVLAITCIAASFFAVFSLRYTVWAHAQIIGDHPLDELGFASLAVASLFVAFVEVAAFKVLGGTKTAVSNIGTNQPTSFDPKYGQPIDRLGG